MKPIRHPAPNGTAARYTQLPLELHRAFRAQSRSLPRIALCVLLCSIAESTALDLELAGNLARIPAANAPMFAPKFRSPPSPRYAPGKNIRTQEVIELKQKCSGSLEIEPRPCTPSQQAMEDGIQPPAAPKNH